MIADYPFKPLFALKPALSKEENEPTEIQTPVKLETMLSHLVDHRSGKKIEICVKMSGSDNGYNGDGSVNLAQVGKLPKNNSISSSRAFYRQMPLLLASMVEQVSEPLFLVNWRHAWEASSG